MEMFEELVADLEDLRAGRLAARDFRLRHPVSASPGEIEPVLCNLEHYLADTETRKRDPEYCHFQESELEKLIRHLRSGDLGKAAAINFLTVTHA